jgi:hypothetical protein
MKWLFFKGISEMDSDYFIAWNGGIRSTVFRSDLNRKRIPNYNPKESYCKSTTGETECDNRRLEVQVFTFMASFPIKQEQATGTSKEVAPLLQKKNHQEPWDLFWSKCSLHWPFGAW